MNSYKIKWLVASLTFNVLFGLASGQTIEKEIPDDLEVIAISGYPPSVGATPDLLSVPISDRLIGDRILKFLCSQRMQKADDRVTFVPAGGEYLVWVITGYSKGIPFVISVNANVLIMSDGTVFRGEQGKQLYVEFSSHLESLKVIPPAKKMPLIRPAPAE